MAGPCRAPRPASPVLQLWGGAEPPSPGAANPFSFREFVRSQSRRAGREPGAASPEEPGRESGPRARLPPRPPGLFFPAPAAGRAPPAEETEEEDEEEAGWGGSYRPFAVERATELLSWAGPEDSGLWPLDESDAPGSGNLSLASSGEAGEEARYSPLQPLAQDLQEENARLRSMINELRFLSETQADKVRELERRLEENKIKEQKEARDLEAMVQHVEQNLQLMTKRAVKAENNVAKLKQENALLQVQLKNYKTENEALKTGQSSSLAAVKQNADVALQSLVSVITNSRSSIKQLVSGAQSLQMVAELLKSIDRISEISDDGS